MLMKCGSTCPEGFSPVDLICIGNHLPEPVIVTFPLHCLTSVHQYSSSALRTNMQHLRLLLTDRSVQWKPACILCIGPWFSLCFIYFYSNLQMKTSAAKYQKYVGGMPPAQTQTAVIIVSARLGSEILKDWFTSQRWMDHAVVSICVCVHVLSLLSWMSTSLTRRHFYFLRSQRMYWQNSCQHLWSWWQMC